MKKVVLVGQMVASTNGLKPLEAELKNQGYDVRAYLAAGKPQHDIAEEIFENAGNADLVLTGMSSEQDLCIEEVKSLELAIARGIPTGLYADTFGVHRRKWFEHLREKITFLFVTNEEEREDARKIYPNSEIIVSGNPSREGYFTPVWTYEQSRQILGIKPDVKVVLCPQGKNIEVNKGHISGVLQAIELLPVKDKFKVLVSLHPGDLNPLDGYSEFLKSGVAGITKKIIPSSALVPPADIIVEAGSDIGVEAACQRKPVISFWTDIALDRLEESTGSRTWPVCEKGASEAVIESVKILAPTIGYLLSEEGYAPMRKRQELLFPKPTEKGSAVRIMAETIKKYLQ